MRDFEATGLATGVRGYVPWQSPFDRRTAGAEHRAGA